MSLRVAHFVQRYPPALGGSEAYFARLSRHLAGAGHRVTVFTTTALDLEAFWSRRGRCTDAGVAVEDGVTVRRYRPGLRVRGRRYVLKPLSLIPHRLWQCLTQPCNPIAWEMWADAGRLPGPFDLVHATAFPYAWPIACGRRLARRLGIPFLVTPFLHLGDPEDPRDRVRRAYTRPPLLALLRDADRVFVQTPGELALLRERGLAQENLVLQGMGYDPEDCTGGDRDAARQSWGVGPDETVIGLLANHSVEKGSVDLLRAAETLARRGRSFRVVLAGPEMPNFRSFWAGYPCQNRVVRAGVLDSQQKRDFFAGIDLFALPSRSDSFGIVLLEAWANGKANVGYRAGGVADVIRHECDGLLVRCGNVPELAEALARLVEDPGLRRRLGQCGQARVEKEHRWQEKLRLVEAAYRACTG